MAAKPKPAPKPRPVPPEVNADAWENVITGLGRSSRDKRERTKIKSPAPSSSYQEFEDLYHGDDIAATIAELPAKEMVRAWINVRADEKDAGDSVTDQVSTSKLVLQALDDLDAQPKVFEALVWSRVFGGSLLFLGVDDGGGSDPQALSKPINERSIRSFDFLQVFDRWDVNVRKWYADPSQPKFGHPELYDIVQTSVPGGLDRLRPRFGIHESRFVRFDGAMTNRRRWLRNNGWADSVYVRVAEVIRDFAAAWGGAAHLLQDFAQAVFKMKGLQAALASDNDDLVINRMILMDMCRSVARAVPLDSDNEEFTRQATPVTGLPDLLDRFALRLSAAARMPASLLMGQSPSGLNATGDADIRFFYDSIKAQQEQNLRPRLNRIVELLFLAAEGPTRGHEPDNWSIEFNPLWQLDEKDMGTLRKTQAEADQIYIMNGVLTPEEVASSRFGGDRYSTDTVLDDEQRAKDAAIDAKLAAMPAPEPRPALPAPANPMPMPMPTEVKT